MRFLRPHCRIVSTLELPPLTRESASKLFRDAQSASLIRGRSIEKSVAGSVYRACRCGGHLLPIEEVGMVAKEDRDKFLLGFRVLNPELDLTPRPLIVGAVAV